jgi:hypothetical protein
MLGMRIPKYDHWFIRLEFKPQDVWIGAFWKHSGDDIGLYYAYRLDIWLCLLPCLPLHIRLERRAYFDMEGKIASRRIDSVPYVG